MLRSRVLLGFLGYGVIVGLASIWWWHYSDNVLPLNIPGTVLGDVVYRYSIEYLGDPYSGQAHFTVPWILRVPQVYAPVSAMVWGAVGMALQCVRALIRARVARGARGAGSLTR
jgi:hypothetical protein